tara:strand:- start:234 stop:797 length:564 start_codon:yes stop_codon:yes gene_type:complete
VETITNKNQGGNLTTLGARSWLDGQAVDQTLLWVDAAGALKGGPSYGPHAISTDVEVKLLANSGPLGIRYAHVQGLGLQRGATVSYLPGAVLGKVEFGLGSATNPLAGVLLFDIAPDASVWLATEGVVPVAITSAGAVAKGTMLTQAVGGNLTDAAATIANRVAILEDVIAGPSAGALYLVRLLPGI